MKKLVTLLAAAGMVVAASAPANAVDVKADARWRASMSTGSTGFEGDNISQARQRLRLGLTATASENLSGYFQFQIGKDRWGTTTNTHGAHDGDDGNNITLRQSYIDWTVPATAAKVRMGRFAIGLPADAVHRRLGQQGRRGRLRSRDRQLRPHRHVGPRWRQRHQC